MASRESSRAEARFMKGQTGVDGQATEEAVDPAELEASKAKEALYRGRTWLGREALTWLLWKSESSDGVFELDGQPVRVVYGGKLGLKAAAGDITEASVKGIAAPYAKLVRQALERGLLVHSARLMISHGERDFECTLDAEFFNVSAAKLPALLQEEESERLTERLELAAHLSRLVDECLSRFVAERISPQWKKTVISLREWMAP